MRESPKCIFLRLKLSLGIEPDPLYPGPYDRTRAVSRANGSLILVFLVTAAVIAFLFALLSPNFASAREAQYKTHFLANVKNSAASILAYSFDSNDRLPPSEKWLDLCEKPNLELNFPNANGEFHQGVYHAAMNMICSRKELESFQESPATVVLTFWSTKPGRNSTDDFESLQWTRYKPNYTIVGTLEGRAKVVHRGGTLGTRHYNGPLGK